MLLDDMMNFENTYNARVGERSDFVEESYNILHDYLQDEILSRKCQYKIVNK